MSTITVTGNLASDPELRFTAKGEPVVNFRIAVNHSVKTEDGWADGEPTFYDVAAFRKAGAENVAESLTKGDTVLVHGEVHTRTWTNPEGEKRTSLQVNAREIGASMRWATLTIAKTPRNMSRPSK